jgi:hypothetical protein
MHIPYQGPSPADYQCPLPRPLGCNCDRSPHLSPLTAIPFEPTRRCLLSFSIVRRQSREADDLFSLVLHTPEKALPTT